MLLTHYLRIGWRNLIKHKVISAINILGLAVGLAAVMLIMLFVQHELSFDRHYRDADRIYRISRDFYPVNGNGEMYLATNAPQAAPLLKAYFPEVEESARLIRGRVLVSRGDAHFAEEYASMADQSFFNIFDFHWLAGEPSRAFDGPASIVITQSLAKKYFGNEAALGQELVIESQPAVRVTGVIADLPDHTHLRLEAFINITIGPQVFGEDFLNNWGTNNFHTYVRLKAGTNIESISRQLSEFVERSIGEGSTRWTGMTATPLRDIHLRTKRETQTEMTAPGSMIQIYTLSSIAFCILLIACINFINLSTAQASLRAKEVAVRKSLGGKRWALIQQFLGESLLLTVLAALVGLALVEISLPSFSAFTDKSLSLNLGQTNRWLLMFAAVATIGLFAGSYPALRFSAIQPVTVLKGGRTGDASTTGFRNLLVILQFSLTSALLIATSVVFIQTRFAQQIELGYNKDQIVVLEASYAEGFGTQWSAFKQSLLEHGDIIAVTASSNLPGESNLNSTTLRLEGGNTSLNASMLIDDDFFETYGIHILAGRALSSDYGADLTQFPDREHRETNAAFMLNALAARQAGWEPQQAVGKWMEMGTGQGIVRGPIVGVAEDVYYESARQAMRPLFYMLAPLNNSYIPIRRASIRISGTNLNDTLKHIDDTWQKFMPDQQISRRFLSQDFDQLYRQETRLGVIFSCFAVLAIILACLGLYATANFSNARRTKEIGIRKALGAKVADIVKLMLWQFSKPVLLANLIAWPVAYYFMSDWLDGFAFRIGKEQIVIFCLLAGIVALLIAWGTVASNAIRAARARPVQALRYE